MAISLARWHLLGLSSNAASRVNIGFGCLASLTHENLRLRLLRLSQRLEPNRPEPASHGLNECAIGASLELASRATSSIVTIKSNSSLRPVSELGGHFRKSALVSARSVLPPQADSVRWTSQVRKVPTSTPAPQQLEPYSSTSSAINRNSRFIVSPSSLAVFKLTSSSNLVGCSTGRSAGFAPFRILSTYVAARRFRSARFDP